MLYKLQVNMQINTRTYYFVNVLYFLYTYIQETPQVSPFLGLVIYLSALSAGPPAVGQTFYSAGVVVVVLTIVLFCFGCGDPDGTTS